MSEQVGEGEAGVVGVLLSTQGGTTARGGQRGMAPVRRCTVATGEEDGGLRITPRPLLNNLQKGPPAEFGNLKEVPEHFYKIQKISYRLQLTFRCCTKFGLAK